MKKNGLTFVFFGGLSFYSLFKLATASCLKTLPPHPRILLNKKDIPLIKRKDFQQNWAAKYFYSLKSNADGWLKLEVKLPERGGNGLLLFLPENMAQDSELKAQLARLPC
jgi:hypothetical protein